MVDAERERVTIQEAARRLGVSESAIRKRIQRGTLQHQKGQDGRVYVYLDTGEDTVQTPVRNEMVDELRDTVRDLRERLDREQEANRENRRIIAGLIERVPELEAAAEPRRSTGSMETPPETPQSAETAYEAAGGVEDPEPVPVPQTTARRPWWLRWLGG